MIKLANLGELNHGWPWIYFHNEVETWVSSHQTDKDRPPDLVSSDTDYKTLPDGFHEVEVYGREATLFLWTSGVRNIITGSKNPTQEEIEAEKKKKNGYLGDILYHTRPEPDWHGLIVFKDTDGYDYAKKKYEEKSRNL